MLIATTWLAVGLGAVRWAYTDPNAPSQYEGVIAGHIIAVLGSGAAFGAAFGALAEQKLLWAIVGLLCSPAVIVVLRVLH